MTFQRPYAGAEALYAAASERFADASRVVFFLRASVDTVCSREAFAARVAGALREAQARNALLRVKLDRRGFVPLEAPIPFELVASDDPHASAIAQIEEGWRAPAESSLFRVSIVMPPGDLRGRTPLTLLVRGHHAACDGFSLVGFAAELLRSLGESSTKESKAIDDPPDILTIARRELGTSWRPLGRALFALLRRGRDVPGPVVQLAPPETATPPLRCMELMFEPDETERLRVLGKERGVGFTAVLVAAAALACESEGRVDIGVAVDLRRLAKATALPASALGFYGAMTDVALAVPRGADLWTLAARADAVLKDGVQDGQPFATAIVVAPLVPFARRMVVAGRTIFPQTLLLSNVGECSALFEGIDVTSAGFASSPRASRKFHVSCTSVRGRLSVCLAWADGALSAARVERFATSLQELIRRR